MRDQSVWSIGLGRWNGVNMRLHMFFLVFAIFTLFLSWRDAHAPSSDGSVWIGVLAISILLISVMLHELGHLIVANRMGGRVDEVVLGPLGGLGPAATPLETHSELVVATAGPLVNLGVCFAAAFCLALQEGVNLVGLMNPFAPAEILTGESVVVGIKLAFWINWLLILANLIPAYPFDGGTALRSLFILTHANMDHQRAVFAVAKVAKFTAVLLMIIAWLNLGPNVSSLQTWFALALLSIFVYFSARKEEAQAVLGHNEDAFLGYDFSAGYTSLEQSGAQQQQLSTKAPRPSMPWVRWWRRRRQLRQQRQREQEVFEDGRVDEILQKVHRHGIESLNAEDRELLTRVSDRYRKRIQAM